MPEVCRFYGIIIRFYYREHPPTHFYAIRSLPAVAGDSWAPSLGHSDFAFSEHPCHPPATP
jgi:hypothetical protein